MKEAPKTKARRFASPWRRPVRASRSERKRRLAFGALERRGLQQDYAQSVKSSILSYYQSQNSSRVASLTRGKLCDQAKIDARVAYYIATADADYAFNLAEIDAKEFALSTKLDLLAIWSRYVINQNWAYDTIKYGGYDSLTYSMIEPNHTYNIATAPFYGGAVTTIPTATYSERNAYFDGIVSASNQIVALKNAADSEDASLATQNESTLAATKSANEATRENAEAAADEAYAVTVENAWKDAYLAQLALGVTLKAAYEATAATFNGALDAAAGDLRDAAFAFAAWDELDAEFEEYARILNYQDMRANLGLTVPADAFEDPIFFDFEVCFAAGTPILMADGSKKPIEEIQPDDVVLAADHLSPEGTPAPACVAEPLTTG